MTIISLDKYALAQAFSAKIRTLPALPQIVAANKDEADKAVCHSHDFVDANEFMLDAFRETFKTDVDLDCDQHLKCWSQAWDIAKAADFFFDSHERFELTRAEFRDFDIFTLPPIPKEWVDRSWHNDACPCFGVIEKDDYSVELYIDYANADQREFPEGERFHLIENLGRKGTNDILITSNFDEILEAINNLKAPA